MTLNLEAEVLNEDLAKHGSSSAHPADDEHVNRHFFSQLHQLRLGSNPIIHVYAEPKDERSADWFSKVQSQREIERIPFRTYIHPQAPSPHWDICQLEKDAWNTTLSDLRQGDIYPAILYCCDGTYLTVAAGVNPIDGDEVVLWTFFPESLYMDDDPVEEYTKLAESDFDSHKLGSLHLNP